MKTNALLAAAAAAFCLALSAGAVERLAVGSLGEPVCDDLETSLTVALPPPSAKNWRLTVEVCGTESNRFECVFGRDSDANSVLDAWEASASVAWEQGVWRVSGGEGLSVRHEAAASSAATNALRLDIRLGRGGGAPESAAFREGGAGQTLAPLAFAGLDPAPAWLDPREWDTLRVTARGGGARAESARVTVHADGTRVILR